MVRWWLIWGLVIIAGGRYLAYRTTLPEFKLGEVVKIETIVENPANITIGKLVVRLPESPRVSYGDKIRVVGKVKEGVISKPGKIFYLSIDKFEIVRSGGKLRKIIENVRQASIDRWKQWLPGDEGALAAGVVLGGTESFSSEAKIAFRRAGISHVVAASGYNVMVVAGWATAMGVRLLGRRLAIPFVILSITLYVLLAGAGPPVVRAGIMAIAAVAGLLVGRKVDGKWLLMLTSLIMVIFKPEWAESISFQLSVGAMAAVLMSGETTKNLKWPWSDLWSTVGVYGFTLPIVLFWFGNISVAAPVANVGVLWVVPLIMEIAAIASVVGWVNPALGQAIAWLAWPELRWVTWLTEMLAGWSGSSWEVGMINWVWVMIYYIVLYLLMYLWRHREGHQV